jgi:hypothetical protein
LRKQDVDATRSHVHLLKKKNASRRRCHVSVPQALHDECLRGAKFVSRLLEALGADVKMAQPYDGKNPVVLGRLGNNPAHPTGKGLFHKCFFVSISCNFFF